MTGQKRQSHDARPTGCARISQGELQARPHSSDRPGGLNCLDLAVQIYILNIVHQTMGELNVYILQDDYNHYVNVTGVKFNTDNG